MDYNMHWNEMQIFFHYVIFSEGVDLWPRQPLNGPKSSIKCPKHHNRAPYLPLDVPKFSLVRKMYYVSLLMNTIYSLSQIFIQYSFLPSLFFALFLKSSRQKILHILFYQVF